MKMRSGPAGRRRTRAGPIQPPSRKPADSGSTASQRTGPKIAKPIPATALARPAMTFFTAFARASGSARIRMSTASSRMPPAAPKYPMYTATPSTVSRDAQLRSSLCAGELPPGSAAASRAGGRKMATAPAAIRTGAT
jgi:hypothetical protein